jgi:hypothetical protein
LSFGGQTALNCGIELYNRGILEKYQVKVLGTPIQTLITSEDRDLFVKALNEINIPVAQSTAVSTVDDALKAADNCITVCNMENFVENIDEELRQPTDQRLFAIAHAMHIGYSVDKIWEMTKIDKWFLNRLAGIVAFEKSLKQFTSLTIPTHAMRTAKQLGFSDRQVARVYGTSELAIRQKRLEQGVVPCVKQIENSRGVILSMGGQTPNNISLPLLPPK